MVHNKTNLNQTHRICSGIDGRPTPACMDIVLNEPYPGKHPHPPLTSSGNGSWVVDEVREDDVYLFNLLLIV